MNQLNSNTRNQILQQLIEGYSLRSTAHSLGVSRNTVSKLLNEIGSRCLEYQDSALHKLPCHRILCEEIWTFKALTTDMVTWTAQCLDTKLVLCWFVGLGTKRQKSDFLKNIECRLHSRRQRSLADIDSASLKTIDEKELPAKIVNSRKTQNRLNAFQNAISAHYMWHNFGYILPGTQETPAMNAGVTDHVWLRKELVNVDRFLE